MEDDDAPLGSGIDVSSTSLRGRFAALSSSGSGGGLSCASGFVRRARGIQYRLRSRRGFSVALGKCCVPNGFIHFSSSSLWCLPLVGAAVFHGVHTMSATASADQLLSSVSLLTVRARKTPTLLPTMCWSVCESLPDQHPSTNCIWLFCKCAPGRRAKTNSPNGNTG